jgi:hypothetical protein
MSNTTRFDEEYFEIIDLLSTTTTQKSYITRKEKERIKQLLSEMRIEILKIQLCIQQTLESLKNKDQPLKDYRQEEQQVHEGRYKNSRLKQTKTQKTSKQDQKKSRRNKNVSVIT